MEILWKIALVLLLVGLNGFFVASEFALVAVRKTRIDELARKGNKAAKIVRESLKHLDTYISATQLGITLASLALGWIGEPALAHFIEPFFSFLPQEAATITAHSVAVAIAFSIITFLHIVLGELAPKTMALQKAETVSLFIIAPLSAFTFVFKPFIWVLNGTGNAILKLFGFSPAQTHQLVHSVEEIKMILNQSSQGGAIAKAEAELVHNAFKLGDIPVKHIMIPRTEIIALNVALTLNDILQKFIAHPHSRFPVYEHSLDNIIGFVHVKDIYKSVQAHGETKKLSQIGIIRDIISIPESKRVDDVLLDMRRKRVHIAIVIDEYGGTTGLITLEDVIESLVGEIEDEFDNPTPEIQKQKDDSYLIDGKVPVNRVLEQFHLPLKGQGYTTIGGLVFGLLGHEPKKHDKLQIGDIVFQVERMEGRRIALVKLKKTHKK